MAARGLAASAVRCMYATAAATTTAAAAAPSVVSSSVSHVRTVTTATGLNHVAIAVPDLAAAAERYRAVLGASVSAAEELPEHGVRVAFVELGNTKLELLEPMGDNSPIARFLEKNTKGGVHHICVNVGDIHAAMEQCKDGGVRLLNDKPKIGAHGNPVCFVHPADTASGVLLEFEEESTTEASR